MTDFIPRTGDPLLEAPAPRELIDRIVRRLRAARFIQVVGHTRPDGDCIGSLLALHELLEQWNIPHDLAADEMPDNGYSELAGFHLIHARPAAHSTPDLIVFVDCANLDRGIPDWIPAAPIINIDHHAGNTRYGEINWIEPRCAAVGEMLYYLVVMGGAKLTPALAEYLLIALSTDTGSFRFSNTTALQHRIAAQLVEAGARIDFITRIAFSSVSLEGARLIGHMLHGLRIECEGRLCWSEIRWPAYRMLGGPEKAPENLVDQLRSIRGVEIALLFHELRDSLRLNLRSNGTYDVSQLARAFGGGGHAAASGVLIEGAKYERDRDAILKATFEFMACANAGRRWQLSPDISALVSEQ